MRIVVSGTHASGKSTLISDFVASRPDFIRLDDPFESTDDLDAGGVSSFVSQFRHASARLLDLAPTAHVIAERGPLDFLAYLIAIEDLGRADTTALVRSGMSAAQRAMGHVDLLVVLPPETTSVGSDEDPALRDAMAEALLDLVDDPDLTGAVRILELSGSPAARLEGLSLAVSSGER